MSRGGRGGVVGGGRRRGGFVIRGINNPGPEYVGSALGMPGGNTPSGSINFGNLRLGVLETDYHYDSQAQLNFFAGRGLKYVRIPFRWERIQPTLNATLNATEAGLLDAYITRCATAGLKVILDLHHFASYWTNTSTSSVGTRNNITISGGTVTQTHFADVWSKLSTRYKDNATVAAYDLGNEPVNMAPVAGSFTAARTWANFDTNTDGFVAAGGNATSQSVVRQTTTTRTGAGALSMTGTFAGSGFTNMTTLNTAVSESISSSGTTLRAWVYPVAGTGTVNGRLLFTDQASGYHFGADTTLTAGQWNLLEWTPTGADATAMATKSRMGIDIYVQGLSSATTRTVYVDDYQQGSVTGALTEAQVWESISQAAVDAIRATGDTKAIYIPTINFMHGFNVLSASLGHPQGPWIIDSANNFGYTFHEYCGTDRFDTYVYADAEAAAQASSGAGGYSAISGSYLKGWNQWNLNQVKTWLAIRRTPPLKTWIGETSVPNATVRPTDAANWASLWEFLFGLWNAEKWPVTAWSGGEWPANTNVDGFDIYEGTTIRSTAAVLEAHQSVAL